jgi:predicted CopG family antitoxin
MTKKLTLSVSDEVYEGLHKRIGRRKISRFIDDLARRHLITKQLDADYAEAAADHVRERDAREWAESGLSDGLPDEDFSDRSGYPSR